MSWFRCWWWKHCYIPTGEEAKQSDIRCMDVETLWIEVCCCWCGKRRWEKYKQ